MRCPPASRPLLNLSVCRQWCWAELGQAATPDEGGGWGEGWGHLGRGRVAAAGGEGWPPHNGAALDTHSYLVEEKTEVNAAASE